ncbi:olfactory receptor 8D1-like [Discoglossus pictus]
MNSTNHSMVTYFILKGIVDVPDLQFPIFLLVLLIYLITLGGNTTILLVVCLESQLHTPMYFFLGNLSIMDMSSITTTLHKVLTSFISGNNTISVPCCITQFYVFASLINGELLLLTAMSYDRYVAICNPLRYHMVMNFRICLLLAIVCWFWSFTETIPLLITLSGFTCYMSKEINHFFCDVLPLIQITCNDTSLLELLCFIISAFHSTIPSLFTFIPYIFIITTILKMHSSTGRRKAFYTCSSHLTVVVLLYASLISQYLVPNSMEANKLFSLFNTAAVPMLNPLIYSLKNKAVNSALRHRLRKRKLLI